VADSASKDGFHRLQSVAVVGGFLDGQRFDLSDGLNCLIGHRGAGKTTALEFVRHVLEATPGRQSAPGGQKRFESLVADNLGDGRIRLRIETKDGIEYSKMTFAPTAELSPEQAEVFRGIAEALRPSLLAVQASAGDYITNVEPDEKAGNPASS